MGREKGVVSNVQTEKESVSGTDGCGAPPCADVSDGLAEQADRPGPGRWAGERPAVEADGSRLNNRLLHTPLSVFGDTERRKFLDEEDFKWT